MAVITSLDAKTTLKIDPTHGAGRVSLRPLDHVGTRVRGHYRVTLKSGALTSAAVVAAAPVLAIRWTSPDLLMVVTWLEAFYRPTTAFTAAQSLGLDLIIARAFTVMDSAGTATDLSGGTGRMRGDMAPSLVTDIQVAIATLLTAGTRTLDSQPVLSGAGIVNVVNAAAGTQYLNPGAAGRTPFGFEFVVDQARGEHPLVLAKNEGIVVRNTTVFPAAGVAELTVNMAWAEVEVYP